LARDLQDSAGAYENVYVNMPSFGLGRAGKLQEAKGDFSIVAEVLG
jgi:hypothetical protein